MKLQLLVGMLMHVTGPLLAQTESINQFDANGYKHGKWMVYLDDEWKNTDSTNAKYYRYTYYMHGRNWHPMGSFKGLTLHTKSTCKLLDGEYVWKDKKGRIRYTHVFEKGTYVLYKEYYKNGSIASVFDYTVHCDGQPYSWMIEKHNKKDTKIKSWYICNR